MHYRRPLNPNTDFVEKNHSSSDSETEHNHTIDQDLSNKKKNITIYRPKKPNKVPLVTPNTRKSILKISRTFDKSSFDEMLQSKHSFIPEKGNLHMEASEISEIEKIESALNRTKSDELIREVSPREEGSPAYRPNKIPNFGGALSKFSPQREQDSIDMSSQTSGYDRTIERKDTEEMKVGGKGSPPSGQAVDSVDATRSRQPSDRGNYVETPGFKLEKAVRTNESGTNNPSSMSQIQQEDLPPPPLMLWNNREEGRSRNSTSELADIFAKKISESSISRKHIKRATFVSTDPKAHHIIPAYTHYVLDENINQQQVYMPHLSDREISEAFNTLDMNKDGYITADEIAYFLEVLEENASEAEIEEMIRMVDYEGTGRVRYEEFFKLALGKNLNPIGQAYPPTLDLFEKKRNGMDFRKLKKGDGLESSTRDLKSFGSQRATQVPLEVHTYTKEQGKIDSKLSKLPRLGDLGDEETKHIKTDKDERDSYFKGFVRQASLNSKTYMERYHKVEFSNDQRVSKATYKDFLGFFCIDDQDVTKKVFSIISKDRNHLDMRQVMIALSLYLDFTVDEKIGLAYNLYDPDGRDGYILYNELMKIFKMFQLGEEHKKIERKIKTSLNWEWKSIMPEDSIPKEDFILICKNFPDLFHSNS